MTTSDWSALWAIGSGIVTLILSVIAIWLSLYFYTRGKDTEKNVTTALAEIKTQTAALERLASRQLDRLTKFATETRPNDPALAEVARTFKEMSMLILQPAPSSPTPSGGLEADLLLSNFQAMYFASVLNALCAVCLKEMSPTDEGYGWVCGIIEQSYMFFKSSEPSLRQADLSLLERNGGLELAREVLDDLAPSLRNVVMAQSPEDDKE